MLKPTAAFALAAAFVALANAQEQCNGLTSAAKDACDMQAAFGGSTVFPDVIPSFSPSGALYLKYGTATVGGAQQLSPSRVASAPTASFSPANSSYSTASKSYVLIVVDHDAPTPASHSQADLVQWLSYGLSVGSDGTLSGGKDAAAYVGPNPPSGSAAHRIVALLYEQPDGFNLPSSASGLPSGSVSDGRVGFDLAGFVSSGKLGSPVGGSFFKTVYDGTVSSSAVTATSSNGSFPRSSGASSASLASSSSSMRSTSRPVAASASGSGAASTAAATGASGSSSTTSDTTSGASSTLFPAALSAAAVLAAGLAVFA